MLHLAEKMLGDYVFQSLLGLYSGKNHLAGVPQPANLIVAFHLWFFELLPACQPRRAAMKVIIGVVARASVETPVSQHLMSRWYFAQAGLPPLVQGSFFYLSQAQRRVFKIEPPWCRPSQTPVRCVPRFVAPTSLC